MTILKILLAGAARRSIQGLGYSAFMSRAACSTLKTKFGQNHLIIFGQLSSIQCYPTIKYQGSKSLVEFADYLSTFRGCSLTFWVQERLILVEKIRKWSLGNCILT